MKKIRAFTLSESLITLMVIGVVAALTIPALMQTYKKHATEVTLKKTYSTMVNAIKMAEVDYGDPETWEIDCSDDAAKDKSLTDKYLLPYLKMAMDSNSSSTADSLNYSVYNPKTGEEVFGFNSRYGEQRNTAFCLNDGVCILPEGISAENGFLIASKQEQDKGYYERLFHFWIDVNGPKAPNAIGKDIFAFYVYKNLDSGSTYVGPAEQWRGISQEKITENEEMCITGSDAGRCTSLIFQNGTFKIPDDYPLL